MIRFSWLKTPLFRSQKLCALLISICNVRRGHNSYGLSVQSQVNRKATCWLSLTVLLRHLINFLRHSMLIKFNRRTVRGWDCISFTELLKMTRNQAHVYTRPLWQVTQRVVRACIRRQSVRNCDYFETYCLYTLAFYQSTPLKCIERIIPKKM